MTAQEQRCNQGSFDPTTEKFTSKIIITPDSEEGGVITPDFTTPVKGLK